MRKPRRAVGVGELSAALAAIVLLFAAATASTHRAREMSKRMTCSVNLKGIGAAAKVYATDYAGSWPVPLSSTTRLQRRYPWGDIMERQRANLWNGESAQTVPVDEFAEGVSVGGVYQLIGNVWEWTAGNFRAGDHIAGRLELPAPMKNIRGGAFDTYFDNQATCQFQSSESPLGRRRNIGVRCAVGVSDLLFTGQAPDGQQQAADLPSAGYPNGLPNEGGAEPVAPTTEEVDI